MNNGDELTRPLFLGIEGGGSHTVAIIADSKGKLIQRVEAGPGNLRLLSDARLHQLFATIAKALPQPDALGIGMAGARSEADLHRIHETAAKIWPGIPCHATNDLETALAAAKDGNAPSSKARVLILSGTGSCCYGRTASGKVARMGGWGHLIGDKGSGYEIGLRALKAIVFYFDRDGRLSLLGRNILRSLQLNEPVELIAWAQSADKQEIAGLTVEVFEAWKKRDQIAADILDGAASSLAKDGISCAKKLTVKKNGRVDFVLAGSVLLKQPGFAKMVADRLQIMWPQAQVAPLKRESVWGAITLAGRTFNQAGKRINHAAIKSEKEVPQKISDEMPFSHFGKTSPTEQRNPRSRHLDKLSISNAIELMLSEDAKIPAAIRRESKKIERAVNLIAHAFKRGGRLFYVGAGTSGRLGVLDASECPPTFRTPPELVQGIIAGGQTALWRSVEGAEDDPAAGAIAIGFRGVTRHDIVVGIAASGRTPFVWGALSEAKRLGAKTVLLAFNPHLAIPAKARPTIVITPNVGPEILTGSTRLKAGTATKLILNIFSTLAMVRIGKVASNLMIDMNPSNAKLQNRAIRIVQELCNVDSATAEVALKRANWVIQKARQELKHA